MSGLPPNYMSYTRRVGNANLIDDNYLSYTLGYNSQTEVRIVEHF
jgi:hypothetical protein